MDIRKTALLISILFLFGMCIQEDNPIVFSLKVGDSLPEFSVKDNNGNVISTTALRNKVSLIAFVNTGCPDCREVLPEIEKAYQTFSNREDVCFVVISRAQSHDSMAQYWSNNHLTLPYSAQDDAIVFNKFASQNIPRIYISSPGGIIRFSSDDSDRITSELLIERINSIINT